MTGVQTCALPILYNDQNVEVEPVRAEIIDDGSFAPFLANNWILFGGDGAEKCRQHLENHPNARFIQGFTASARHMNLLSSEKFKRQDFVDLAYFEPFYLKDFVAGKPRVKGLK